MDVLLQEAKCQRESEEKHSEVSEGISIQVLDILWREANEKPVTNKYYLLLFFMLPLTCKKFKRDPMGAILFAMMHLHVSEDFYVETWVPSNRIGVFGDYIVGMKVSGPVDFTIGYWHASEYRTFTYIVTESFDLSFPHSLNHSLGFDVRGCKNSENIIATKWCLIHPEYRINYMKDQMDTRIRMKRVMDELLALGYNSLGL